MTCRDPAKPVHIRDFGRAGPAAGLDRAHAAMTLHGAISTGPKGNRIYFGYGTSRNGVAADPRPRRSCSRGREEPIAEEPPLSAGLAPRSACDSSAHTRHCRCSGWRSPKFAKDEDGHNGATSSFVVNEPIQNECREQAPDLVYFVDITDETQPFPVANYQRCRGRAATSARAAAASARTPRTSTSIRPTTSASVFLRGSMPACARSTSAIRTAREKIGYYIPAMTDKTDAALRQRPPTVSAARYAIQTNNVEVDDRGYIYIVDRANTGMHVLELTGAARRVADFKRQGCQRRNDTKDEGMIG